MLLKYFRTRKQISAENGRLRRANQFLKDYLIEVSYETTNKLDQIRGAVVIAINQLRVIENTEAVISPLRVSEKAFNSLGNLLNNSLKIGEIEAGKPLPIEPAMVEIRPFLNSILEIYQLFETTGSSRIILEIEDNTPKFLFSDERTLQQVLTNLIDNALKYGTEGSPVQIHLSLTLWRWVIKITSFGPGILSGKLAHVFGPSVITQEAKKVAGLSPFIIEKKIAALRGSMEVENILGVKSTYVLYLPVIGVI